MPFPICQGQTFVDGLSGEKFQLHAGLLAICKVCLSPLDVQWNGW
jgi:hypothetical protein